MNNPCNQKNCAEGTMDAERELRFKLNEKLDQTIAQIYK